MSSITHTDAIDYSCYYDETSDQYHIPKEELDEFVEVFRVIQKQKEQITEERERYFGYLKDKDLECETQRELYETEYKKLEELQSDLSRLDDFKDGLTGVCDYDDLVVYMNARFDEIHRLESERDAFEEQLHKSLEGQVKDTEEIEELKTSLQTTTSYHTDKYELLKDENKKLNFQVDALDKQATELCLKNTELKEQVDGIMNDTDSQHILGCNAYEKFMQAMCELNHDEEWITELKEEIQELKEKYEGELVSQEDFGKD